MSDLISRQAAIDALESGKDKTAKGDIGGFYNAIIQNNMDKLRNLPSAEPRKKGKWLLIDAGYYDETTEAWYGRDLLELLVNAWMPLPEPYQPKEDEE